MPYLGCGAVPEVAFPGIENGRYTWKFNHVDAAPYASRAAIHGDIEQITFAPLNKKSTAPVTGMALAQGHGALLHR